MMIKQLTKALDDIKEPLARANIFWLVGQHCGQLPTIAPDVLRIAAKSFCSEVGNNSNIMVVMMVYIREREALMMSHSL